eukprot:jgi/Ulvmu1/10493/UM064_0030.1
MGAARRLQQEIDAVLKKVKEGISTFDDTYEKLMQNQSPQQREKLVASLKDQIKKLQKDRDKIKTWASDKDVRDKQTLADNRATIERRMERFKECEKDMKVKDFSKVGLEKGNKLDPKQVAIEERREWIRTCVEQIGNTVEMNEAEMENIRVQRRAKEPPARVARIQDRNAAHKKHQERLEQVLRALDNEALSVDQVDQLKETIEDYLENGNTSDEETWGMYEDVDAFYDEEVLEIIGNVDVHVPMVGDRILPRIPEVPEKPEKKGREAKDAEKAARDKDRDKGVGARATTAAAAKGSAAPQSEVDEKPVPVSPLRMPVFKEPPPPPPPRGSQPALASPSAASMQAAASPPSVQTGPSESASVARASASGVGNAWGAAAEEAPAAPPTGAPKLKLASAAVPVNGQAPAAKGSAALAGAPPPGLAPKTIPTQAAAQAHPEGAAAAAPVLEPGSLMMMLQDKRPHPFDGVWHRYACSRKTRASRPCPTSYPRVPLAILDMPKFYSSIPKDNDLDLFAIFYLTPGTQYQYLAACELRQRNWRYHKEQKAWFQRAEPPSERTQTYERGDYIYFDSTISESDDSWVFRLKKDFKVDYSQVEGDAWCEDYSVIGMA